MLHLPLLELQRHLDGPDLACMRSVCALCRTNFSLPRELIINAIAFQSQLPGSVEALTRVGAEAECARVYFRLVYNRATNPYEGNTFDELFQALAQLPRLSSLVVVEDPLPPPPLAGGAASGHAPPQPALWLPYLCGALAPAGRLLSLQLQVVAPLRAADVTCIGSLTSLTRLDLGQQQCVGGPASPAELEADAQLEPLCRRLVALHSLRCGVVSLRHGRTEVAPRAVAVLQRHLASLTRLELGMVPGGVGFDPWTVQEGLAVASSLGPDEDWLEQAGSNQPAAPAAAAAAAAVAQEAAAAAAAAVAQEAAAAAAPISQAAAATAALALQAAAPLRQLVELDLGAFRGSCLALHLGGWSAFATAAAAGSDPGTDAEAGSGAQGAGPAALLSLSACGLGGDDGGGGSDDGGSGGLLRRLACAPGLGRCLTRLVLRDWPADGCQLGNWATSLPGGTPFPSLRALKLELNSVAALPGLLALTQLQDLSLQVALPGAEHEEFDPGLEVSAFAPLAGLTSLELAAAPRCVTAAPAGLAGLSASLRQLRRLRLRVDFEEGAPLAEVPGTALESLDLHSWEHLPQVLPGLLPASLTSLSLSGPPGVQGQVPEQQAQAQQQQAQQQQAQQQQAQQQELALQQLVLCGSTLPLQLGVCATALRSLSLQQRPAADYGVVSLPQLALLTHLEVWAAFRGPVEAELGRSMLLSIGRLRRLRRLALALDPPRGEGGRGAPGGDPGTHRHLELTEGDVLGWGGLHQLRELRLGGACEDGVYARALPVLPVPLRVLLLGGDDAGAHDGRVLRVAASMPRCRVLGTGGAPVLFRAEVA